jgi:formate hydrogenlyase subunit 3/multisubunit Na+/H+ antiporter MnhD subunit
MDWCLIAMAGLLVFATFVAAWYVPLPILKVMFVIAGVIEAVGFCAMASDLWESR